MSFKAFSEDLINKTMGDQIKEMTKSICRHHFEQIFNSKCELKNTNNTTLGMTYEALQDMATNEVTEWVGYQLEEVNIHRICSKGNPFIKIIDCLIGKFEQHLNYNFLIDDIISDEQGEMQNKLYKMGIVDDNGDYISNCSK